MGDSGDKLRNTDVDGSIAGYFFQILLGVEALTKLTNNDDEVGIECGADVRIITKIDKYISIEAKFHKKNMNRYHNDIIKTIYNFYCNSNNDKQMYFETNVDLNSNDDREFFNKIWKDDKQVSCKVEYIKQCILIYCIKCKSKKEQKYRKKFLEYKKNNNGENEADDIYIKKLIEDIRRGKENYCNYGFYDSNINYEEFASKIIFKFRNELKKDSITRIEQNIKRNLRINFKTEVEKLELEGSNILDKVINVLVYEFLKTTSDNSEVGTKNLEIKYKKKISVKELKQFLSDYNDENYCNYENNLLLNIKDTFKDAENQFIETIEDYAIEYKDRLLEIYFELRYKFFYMNNINEYKKTLNTYCLGLKENNIFLGYEIIIDKLIFLTILTFIKELNNMNVKVSDIACTSVEDSVDNLFFDKDEKYCFKGVINFKKKDFQNFFICFIRETYNCPKLFNIKEVIAGNEFRNNKAPCNYKGKDGYINKQINFPIKQSKIKNNLQMEEFYRSLNYRCIGCVYLNDEIESVIQKSEKFIKDECRES